MSRKYLQFLKHIQSFCSNRVKNWFSLLTEIVLAMLSSVNGIIAWISLSSNLMCWSLLDKWRLTWSKVDFRLGNHCYWETICLQIYFQWCDLQEHLVRCGRGSICKSVNVEDIKLTDLSCETVWFLETFLCNWSYESLSVYYFNARLGILFNSFGS